MPRTIAVEEAFSIVQRVYGAFGWKPDDRSSREQRNGWLESALACVHYGHAQFNPAGGDPRWCIKSAGGGRPQSDDVIVYSTTRAYWDIILSAGAAGWSWNLGGHSESLPPEQQVYAPSQASLPGGGGVDPGPGPDPDPDPDPTPTPDPGGNETEKLILLALGNLHAKVDHVIAQNADILAKLVAAEKQQAADTGQIGTWMVEQATGTVKSIVGVNPDGVTGDPLGPRIDAVKDAQCILRGKR
jgi:hypothetical protein